MIKKKKNMLEEICFIFNCSDYFVDTGQSCYEQVMISFAAQRTTPPLNMIVEDESFASLFSFFMNMVLVLGLVFLSTDLLQRKAQMSLKRLLANKAHPSELATYLDQLSHSQRWKEVGELNRKQQSILYDLCAKSEPITLEHFVPSTYGDLVEVVHHGRNTLPLISKLKNFQKRFCRPLKGKDCLYGFNEGPTRWWIGPGYFVANLSEGRSEWMARGQVVVDYYKVPEKPLPYGWPKLIPNHKGAQVFVYNHMRDFMRKVSEHVSVGRAFKDGKEMNAWFVLCREDRKD